jgi:hypothetical protein
VNKVKETAIDLRENIAAMYIAILRDDVFTPEQAFRILEGKDIVRHRTSNEDTEDMIAMREQGMTYREIGEIYGMAESSVLKRIKNYKKKDLSDGHLKRSSFKKQH